MTPRVQEKQQQHKLVRGGDILESVVNECIVSHMSPGVSVSAVGVSCLGIKMRL